MKLSKILLLVLAFFAAEFLIIQDAYARRGFRSSTSRSWGSKSKKTSSWGSKSKDTNDRTRKSKSSWDSRSKSNPSSSKTSNKAAVASTPKPSRAVPYQKTAFQRKMSRSVSGTQANKSLTAYKQEQTKFKPLTVDKKAIDRNPTFQKFKSKGDYHKPTYYARRDRFYKGYSNPNMYRSFPSFGIWDGLMLWFILDNISQASNKQMYYNNMNDEGIKQFRSEAEKLAQSDEQLKAKLEQLDKEMAVMKASGVAPKPGVLPAGIDPDLFLAGAAMDRLQPSINLCSGVKSGNYHYAANLMKENSLLEINLVPTKGSKDNFDKIDQGICDAAIVQKDAIVEHDDQKAQEKVDVAIEMYPEFAHLICRESDKVDSIKDLSSEHRVSIGFENSGSALTWKNMKVVQSNLSSVKVDYEGPSTGLMKLQQGKVNCIFSMVSLGSSFLDSKNVPKKLKLVHLDVGLDAFKDRDGNRIYEDGEIEAGAYPKLQESSFLGGSKATKTFFTRASLVISDKWKQENEEGYDQISEVLLSVKPKIDNHVDPKG